MNEQCKACQAIQYAQQHKEFHNMKHKSETSHKIGRDAKTGEFIPVKEAQRRPSTAVVETIKHQTSTKKK